MSMDRTDDRGNGGDAAWITHLNTGNAARGPERQTRGERRVGVDVSVGGHGLVDDLEGARTLRL